ALILFLAFGSLASAPLTDLKVLATGLGVGILLDATIVRALLVPALIAVFGKWNWWFPNWAGRALRVSTATPAPADDAIAGNGARTGHDDRDLFEVGQGR
ncbi:MAG: MMPL family transporter, partial [Acidimicrobiales bacterium]